MGKSVLLRHIIKGMQKTINPLFFIFDTENQHRDLEGPRTQVYRPEHPPGSKQSITEFNRVCGKIYEQRGIMFVVENINAFTSPNKPLPYEVANIVNRGRERKIGLIETTQRIAKIHMDLRAQCNHWFVFKTYISNDLEYLRRNLGKTYSEKIDDLPKYYFLYWDIIETGDKQICPPVPYTEAIK